MAAYMYPIGLALVSGLVMLLEHLFPWRPGQKQLRPKLWSDLISLVFNGHFLGHHSVEDGEMDWIVSFRFSWLEVVVYKSVLYLPMVFLGFRWEALMFHAIFGTARMPNDPPAHIGFAGVETFPDNFFSQEIWPLQKLAPGVKSVAVWTVLGALVMATLWVLSSQG